MTNNQLLDRIGFEMSTEPIVCKFRDLLILLCPGELKNTGVVGVRLGARGRSIA